MLVSVDLMNADCMLLLQRGRDPFLRHFRECRGLKEREDLEVSITRHQI